jgi:hypothetical protein
MVLGGPVAGYVTLVPGVQAIAEPTDRARPPSNPVIVLGVGSFDSASGRR